MLKPRAETGGERKSKPKSNVVNPRYQAKMIRVTQMIGGPEQTKFSQDVRSGKLKQGTKAYEKRYAKMATERTNNTAKSLGLKGKKAYTKAEQKSNAKKVQKLIDSKGTGNKGRRAKADLKTLMTEVPATVKKMVGEKAYTKLVRQATRTGTGAKGGGKKNKTGKYAVIGGTKATVKEGKTVKTVQKMGGFKQGYAPKGDAKKAKGVQKGVTQFDTSFRGQGGNPRAGGTKKANPKAEKKQFTKKTTTKTTGGKAPAKQTPAKTPTAKNTAKPAKAVTTKNTTKTTPAPKPAAPAPKPANAPKFTPAQIEAQNRILGKKTNKGTPAKNDDFFGKGPAPLTTPKGEKPSIADTLAQIRGNKPKKGKK